MIVWGKGQSARLTEFADKLMWAERQTQARLAPQIAALQADLERTFAMAFDPEAHVVTLYASHDDALVQLQDVAVSQRLHLDIRFCGSVDAIRALNEGRCTLAGFHTRERPARQSLSAQQYRGLLKPGQHKLLGFALRQQGLMVAPGNCDSGIAFASIPASGRAGIDATNRANTGPASTSAGAAIARPVAKLVSIA